MFLANMSHELRTPLNAILGFSEVMRDQVFGPVGNERYAGYINDISESASHLHSMLSDLINVSQIEAGNYSTAEEIIDPVEQIEACRPIVAGLLEDRRSNLSIGYEQEAAALRADPRMFRQIALNLITNAAKSRGSDANIEVTIALRSGSLVLRVADNGEGIPKHLIANVTDPFFRIEGSALRKNDGSGLGLSIVKSFVSIHEAEIRFDSKTGTGTVVSVIFPPERVVCPVPSTVMATARKPKLVENPVG